MIVLKYGNHFQNSKMFFLKMPVKSLNFESNILICFISFILTIFFKNCILGKTTKFFLQTTSTSFRKKPKSNAIPSPLSWNILMHSNFWAFYSVSNVCNTTNVEKWFLKINLMQNLFVNITTKLIYYAKSSFLITYFHFNHISL